jgi:hypothetical protein
LSSAGAGGNAPLDRGRGECRQQRVLLGEGIGLRRITILAKAVLLQELCELVRHADDDATDFFIVGRWEWVESGRSVFGDFIDAIECERVDVAIQVDRRTESLQETHSATLQTTQCRLLARSPVQGREESAEKDIQDLTHQLRVVGTAITEAIRERQDPLSYRHLG